METERDTLREKELKLKDEQDKLAKKMREEDAKSTSQAAETSRKLEQMEREAHDEKAERLKGERRLK